MRQAMMATVAALPLVMAETAYADRMLCSYETAIEVRSDVSTPVRLETAPGYRFERAALDRDWQAHSRGDPAADGRVVYVTADASSEPFVVPKQPGWGHVLVGSGDRAVSYLLKLTKVSEADRTVATPVIQLPVDKLACDPATGGNIGQ